MKFRVGQRLLENDSKDRQRLSWLVIYVYVLPCYSYYVGTTLSDDSRFHFMLWDFVESNNRRMKKKHIIKDEFFFYLLMFFKRNDLEQPNGINKKRGTKNTEICYTKNTQANRQSLLFIIVHKLNYHMARSQDIIS